MTTATWTLEVDSNHDGVYETDLTARLIEAALQYGMQDSYQQMAPASELVLGFSNEGGAFNQDNPAATYYNKLVPGSLVRLKVVLSGVTYVQYIGQIGMGSIQPGRYNQAVTDAHRTTLHVIDPMPRLIAGEYNPPLQTSVRVDEVFQQILDTGLVPWPYDASYGLYDYSTYDNALYFIDTLADFEQARTTLPFAGDTAEVGTQRGVQPYGYISDILLAEAGGRFWYEPTTARLKFHNRYHDIQNAVIAAVPTAIVAVDPDDIHYGDRLANVVQINYLPRRVGTPGSILFASNNVPFALAGRQQLQIQARYSDPTTPTARVGGLDVIKPTLGGDIIANAQSGGGGADRISDVGFAAQIGATSTTLTLINNSQDTIYITTCQIRGTPLITDNQESAIVQDAASIGTYNRQPLAPIQISAISDADFATAYANKLLGQFKAPFTRIAAVTVQAANPTDLVHVLARTVGDRVTITDSFSGHSKPYVIVGVEKRFVAPATDATGYAVRWILKPWTSDGMGFYDVSTYDGTATYSF